MINKKYIFLKFFIFFLFLFFWVINKYNITNSKIPFNNYKIKFTKTFIENYKNKKTNIFSSTIETYNEYKNNEINTYIKKDLINKFNLYIRICLNSILIDKKEYPLLNNPKISIIMPLYNGGNYLHYSLRSIQNQKMKEIEIILIDDNSSDDTLLKVYNFMKEDSRIRLIKNNVNRRILYSKSMGALNAKGKYIIILDQDDMFIREDLFDTLYYEAEKNNLDLIQIRDINLNKFYFDLKEKVNCPNKHYIFPKKKFNFTHYENQSQLKNEMFVDDNIFLLWGLFIKADIYKKAIYHLWPVIINYQIIHHEDFIITSMIVILAKNYKYLNNFGLIHFINNNSAANLYKEQYFISILFNGMNFYHYYIKDNPQDIKISFNYIKRYKYIFKELYKLNPNNIAYYIRNIINSQYLSLDDKEYILKELEIDKNQFQSWNSYLYLMNTSEFKDILNFQKLSYTKTIKQINNTLTGIRISIIILCYEFKYLKNTINSILNQIFEHYEIIIIYDNDDYNNLYLIQNYIKNFKNIKLVNNKNKRGKIYSYSIGILSSIGEYIMMIEPGQNLAKNNILDNLYNYIVNSKFDIVEFDLLINYNDNITNNSLNLYICEHIIPKINLTSLKFNKNYKGIEREKEILSNKLIKLSLFKKIIKEYKLIDLNIKLYNYYDDIIFFILSKYEHKFNHMNLFGIIKYINKTNNLYKNNLIDDKAQIIHDSIFYINFLFEHTKNSFQEKEIALNEFNDILSILFNKFNKKNNKTMPQYQLIDKFLNCKYINEFNKYILKFYFISLIN